MRCFLLAPWTPGLELLEEVVALVIDEDECRKVLDGNLPDGFHSEFRILNALNALDATLGENGCHAADGAEIEASVLLAGIGNLLAAVAFRYHDEAAAVCLELIDIRVHSACSGGSH